MICMFLERKLCSLLDGYDFGAQCSVVTEDSTCPGHSLRRVQMFRSISLFFFSTSFQFCRRANGLFFVWAYQRFPRDFFFIFWIFRLRIRSFPPPPRRPPPRRPPPPSSPHKPYRKIGQRKVVSVSD